MRLAGAKRPPQTFAGEPNVRKCKVVWVHDCAVKNIGNEPVLGLNEQRIEWLKILSKTEVDMENALLPVQIIFYLMGGLGLFFLGVGVLWFVDVYKKKNEL